MMQVYVKIQKKLSQNALAYIILIILFPMFAVLQGKLGIHEIIKIT